MNAKTNACAQDIHPLALQTMIWTMAAFAWITILGTTWMTFLWYRSHLMGGQPLFVQ